MQQHEQREDDDSQSQIEILARQKRFALVLSGDDQLAQMLVDRLHMMGDSTSNSTLSPSALQFYQFKNLYELWMSKAKTTSGVAHIFQPGRENEAIQRGLDPSIAKIMGGLPSLHRALLLLVYGENFSYAATAQLLNITTEELMTALAAARRKFGQRVSGMRQAGDRVNAGSVREVGHDATQ